MYEIHIHIGHHFFGAGNIGDDLMLAGALRAFSNVDAKIKFTCSCPFDLDSQRLRFPEINWCGYDPGTRARCVSECDVWLGLGDTPFQTDSGLWFLQHLSQEMSLCKAFNKPVYFLGVGVNNPEAIAHPVTQMLISCAKRIWTRDEYSAKLLSRAAYAEKICTGADLGFIFADELKFAAPVPNSIGYVLNFESIQMFDAHSLCEFINNTSDLSHLWLYQEVRTLPGSEGMLYSKLPENCKSKLKAFCPDYKNCSLEDLFASWGTPEIMFTSRYHGAILGATMGARVVAVQRNAKLVGISEDLGINLIKDFRNSSNISNGLNIAEQVPRSEITKRALRATECCTEFISEISTLV